MLKLALPNGSLEKNTLLLFESAGINIQRQGRNYRATTDSPLISEVIFTRPQAIPRLVYNHVCDAGMCGQDNIVEFGCLGGFKQENFFAYSKITLTPTHIVLIGHENDPIDSALKIDAGTPIYTEYPNFTTSFFTRGGKFSLEVEIVPSPGSTEAHIPLEFPYGVCAIETGRTIKANGLRIISNLYTSLIVLITRSMAPKVAEDKPWSENDKKRIAAVEELGWLLNEAGHRLGYKKNVT